MSINNNNKDLLLKTGIYPCVYVSTFENQKEKLMLESGNNNYIFTSLHVCEEMDNNFTDKITSMCHSLKEYGYKIIADISKDIYKAFNTDNMLDIVTMLGIDIIRLDYGFSEDEILEIANKTPVALNASMVSLDVFERISKRVKVIAIHNFYPRPETGLDESLFDKINVKLKDIGIPTFAFISGDEKKRGPLNEGLPTLEIHRSIPPLLSFCDMVVNHHVNGIFIGDGFISRKQELLIRSYIKNDIMPVPTRLLDDYKDIFDRVFTVRIDSPKHCMRLNESREYSKNGKIIEPDKRVERRKGAITMDNKLYKRYSGEIQIMKETLPVDEKVNVIGRVNPIYFNLLSCIPNGKKFMFINEDNL